MTSPAPTPGVTIANIGGDTSIISAPPLRLVPTNPATGLGLLGFGFDVYGFPFLTGNTTLYLSYDTDGAAYLTGVPSPGLGTDTDGAYYLTGVAA